MVGTGEAPGLPPSKKLGEWAKTLMKHLFVLQSIAEIKA